jgi:hypothetical protein
VCIYIYIYFSLEISIEHILSYVGIGIFVILAVHLMRWRNLDAEATCDKELSNVGLHGDTNIHWLRIYDMIWYIY